MRAEGLPELAIDTFADYARRLAEGEQGMLPEDELEPVADLPEAADLPEEYPEACSTAPSCSSSTAASARAWALTGPKSLLEVKDGLPSST